MISRTKKLIEISEFLSILGDEFMHYSGYGVFAFLTHQMVYDYYGEYVTAKVPVETFTRKLVREYLDL